MVVSSLSWDLSQPPPLVETEAERWYGLHTRPRHEKIVAHRLEERGVTTFLPLVTEVHRWSDRKKTVQMPLFSCYVFAKFIPDRLSHPFLKIGQRVRIRSGALDGLEGILVSRNGDHTLVISIDAIQRSLAVRVEGYEVEPA